MRRYTVLLTPDLEDGGYVVTVPALPGCVTQGETYEEAVEMAKDVIPLFLDALTASGEPIPEETVPPRLALVELDDGQVPSPQSPAHRTE